jgi:hypothetical protein
MDTVVGPEPLRSGKRVLDMEYDQKVWAAAALLLKRHGVEAPAVAKQWSGDLAKRDDPEAAAKCLEIADAASELLTKRAVSGAREPTLTEILSGAVTGAVMRADQVHRRDVERVMKKAKQRRK